MEAAKQALAPDGDIPLTIIVLDEVQQYINEVQDRSGTITDLAEALQTQFGSRVPARRRRTVGALGRNQGPSVAE